MLDLVVKNGRIVDGTGNPWFYGDVGIKDGVIAEVGRIKQESREIIDAQGRVIAPGFIDGHTHSDLMILDNPYSEIKLQQGVTTEVVGNCGLAPTPFSEENRESLQSYMEPVLGTTSREWSWETVGQYVGAVVGANPSENVSTYVAHGALRAAVMGFENRPASTEELTQMKYLLDEGLEAGAIGLSTGLVYAPAGYASSEELAELCDALPKFDGIFATHIRGEGSSLLPSIEEVIWVVERSGVPLHVSHLKAAGRSNWGKVTQAMDLIEGARTRGLDVTCDVYPYSAGSTTLTSLLPPWALEGGVQQALERIRDSSVRRRIEEELDQEQDEWDNLVVSTGWERVLISSVNSEDNLSIEGKSIAEISESRGVKPTSCALDLLLEEDGKVSIIVFHMSDDDVNQVIGWDKSLIASDSLHSQTKKPHPRLFGTFPRVFSKCVREDRVLTLEQAVRKVTSFPAQRFRLGKRGLLAPGYDADIVVFDPDEISDKATYEEPNEFPDGISHVLVNGRITVESGTHQGAREGTLITSHGHRW